MLQQQQQQQQQQQPAQPATVHTAPQQAAALAQRQQQQQQQPRQQLNVGQQRPAQPRMQLQRQPSVQPPLIVLEDLGLGEQDAHAQRLSPASEAISNGEPLIYTAHTQQKCMANMMGPPSSHVTSLISGSSSCQKSAAAQHVCTGQHHAVCSAGLCKRLLSSSAHMRLSSSALRALPRSARDAQLARHSKLEAPMPACWCSVAAIRCMRVSNAACAGPAQRDVPLVVTTSPGSLLQTDEALANAVLLHERSGAVLIEAPLQHADLCLSPHDCLCVWSQQQLQVLALTLGILLPRKFNRASSWTSVEGQQLHFCATAEC